MGEARPLSRRDIASKDMSSCLVVMTVIVGVSWMRRRIRKIAWVVIKL